MITATVKVADKDGALAAVFSAEEKSFPNNRASYEVRLEGGTCVIELSALDASALRAVMNSVAKVLVVFEKAKSVVDDDE